MTNQMPPRTKTRASLTVVLAAGEGTRMRSGLPKVMHKIAGKAMLAHVLQAASGGGRGAVAVVVGPGRDDVAALALGLDPNAEIFVQTERRGTAHAVLAARDALLRGADDVLVAFADTPLILPQTYAAMRAKLAEGAGVVVLGFKAQNPAGYGRLLMQGDELVAIREHKDATEAERATDLCNAGLMALDGRSALAILEAIGSHNAQGEFYLTDAVEIARAQGLTATALVAPETEVLGVNDRVQLAQAEQEMQQRLREAAMRAGVTLIDPASVTLSADTVFGRDVLIEPHVVIGPGVEIAGGAVIHAFTHLEGAVVGPGATAGPFARLRPGARLGAKAKVGNFVEIKSAEIGADAKVSHLSYIGDATVGAGANIGAGVITCNYDGFLKYKTEIGAGAFVGSNCSLVAPVVIGAGAYVGSGSVITRNVKPDALALERSHQLEKPGWARMFRDKMKVLVQKTKAKL